MVTMFGAAGTLGPGRGLAMSLAMFDGPDALSSSHAQLLMWFIGLATVALFVQAVVFSVMAIGAIKAQKRILSVVDEFRATAIPLIKKSQAVVEELSPKVRDIAENISDISSVVRAKAREFEPTLTAVNETVADANQKTKAQVKKVDGMVTTALNATAELAAVVHQGIRGPVKEVAGIINGLKTGFETLVQRSRAAATTPPSTPVRSKPTVVPAPVAPAPVAPAPVVPSGPAPDAAPAAAAEVRNELSFAAYRAAMQAKRRDLDL